MTIYAIAIATNLQQKQHTTFAMTALQQLGQCQFSPIYQMPCRDGVGAEYWNCACLLCSSATPQDIAQQLKDLEQQTGRKRPSHQISLDVDLIAWGESLNTMQFNPKKLPLADDVVIPLSDLWQTKYLPYIPHQFLQVSLGVAEFAVK